MNDLPRTPDGFVIAFPPLQGEFPFERDPVIEAYKKGLFARSTAPVRTSSWWVAPRHSLTARRG